MTDHLHLFLRDETHRDAIERGETPRLKRPGLILPLLCSMVFIALGASGLTVGLKDIREGYALRTGGQLAQATITRMYTSKGRNKTNHHIDYIYQAPPDPQRHQRSTTLDQHSWRATCQGCKIEIRYAVAAPSISRLSDQWPLANGSALSAVMCAILGFGALMAWSTIDEQRRHRRLQRLSPRMGTILDVSAQRRGKTSYLDLLLQLDGDDATLTYSCPARAHRSKPPQVGQRIAALYHSPTDFELA
jgi:hypothetical protein